MKPTPPPRAGLVSWDEAVPVILPLKGVLAEFAVAGGVAEVTMIQAFLQENARPLNCRYLFPLPADAAVFRCEVEVNGRRLVARVEERERALALAREAWQSGHRTVVVESERENLFTLSLGNVQPGDFVEVRLRYLQPLRRFGEALALTIPFNPGVRYIPGRPLLRSNRGPGVVDDTDEVPDASRISPPRITADHPDAAFVEVQGRIAAAWADPASVTSPSHEILVTHEAGWARVGLRRHGEPPSEDLVLRWNEPVPDRAVARAWGCQRGGETYGLLELRAPRWVPEAGAPPRDVYFLVDRSSSMEDAPWAQAIIALRTLVAGLQDVDRVMVTFFNSTFRDFAEAPRAKRELLADPAFGALARLGTTGGTEMGPALAHILEIWRRHSTDRASDLVIITDAEVGNEDRVVGLLAGAAGLRVHTVGVHYALNDDLLARCARQGGGTFHALHPRDDLATLATSLRSVLAPAVWRNFEVVGNGELSDRIPDLQAGQVAYASLRFSGSDWPRLRARDADGREVSTEFVVEPAPGEAPYLQWARSRIRALLESEETAAEAVALSCAANLICPRTAFVAWDETNRVPIAGDQLWQPNLARFLPQDSIFASDHKVCRRAMAMPPELQEEVPALTLRARITYEFDRGERRRQLMMRFRDLHRRGGVSDGDAAFDRLLDWAGAAPTDRESEDRFAEIQALVMELDLLVRPIESGMKHLSRLLEELEALLGGAAERVRGFRASPLSGEFGLAIERRLDRIGDARREVVLIQGECIRGRERLAEWLQRLPGRLPVAVPATSGSA